MRTFKFMLETMKSRVNSARFAQYDYRTDRYVVVFESDDWGSIRMSNKKDWEELLRMGYAVDKRPYERYDTLESAEDLEALYEVLSRHIDCNGNHPVITANMLMANPDFEKIEKSGFQEYYYEPIAKTYERYYGNTNVLELMKHGMEEGVFMPQSHGREHFNVAQWMRRLRDGNEDLLTAFRHGMCGIAPKAHPEKGNKMMNALLAENEKEEVAIGGIVTEGLQMFEELWRFKSKTFVAPCYLWNEQTERVLDDGGVKLIQTSRVSKPAYKSSSRYFYSGQRNILGQVYSIRNCHFEPATNEEDKTPETLLAQINKTFTQHKIAVFSTHRINYVGGIDATNRLQTLRLLDDFLTQLLRKYPDVEFMSSDKLIEIFDQQ